MGKGSGVVNKLDSLFGACPRFCGAQNKIIVYFDITFSFLSIHNLQIYV